MRYKLLGFWFGKRPKYKTEIKIEDKDDLELIYRNAIGVLNEIKEGSKLLNNRVVLLFGYLIATVGFSFVYVINNYPQKDFNTESLSFIQSIVGVILVWNLFVSILMFIFLLIPTKSYGINSIPKVMLKKERFEDNDKPFLLKEIEDIQDRISSNFDRQNNRNLIFKILVGMAILMPVVLVIKFITLYCR